MIKIALNGEQKNFAPHLDGATKLLKDIYGFQIHDLKNATFIMTSESSACSPDEFTREQKSQYTLLHLILSFIFMRGGQVTEVSLWEYLSDFEINPGRHDYFGDVKKLVEETFVKQLYLDRVKQAVENSTEVNLYYQWGYRSEFEIDKKQMLIFVCDVLNIPTISFIKQYEEAYGKLVKESVSKIVAEQHTKPSQNSRRRSRKSAAQEEEEDEEIEIEDDDEVEEME